MSAEGLSLSWLLGAVCRGYVARVEEVLGAVPLSVDQWWILELLNDGLGRPMGDLAAHLRTPAGTLTKIVDRLVEAAAVYRLADESDRRRVLVYISEHGQSVVEAFRPRLVRVEVEFLGALGPAAADLRSHLEALAYARQPQRD